MNEIIIVPNDNEKNGHVIGSFFESLANSIFKTQRYEVSSNINYTGMEFDLECTHMDRTNEKVLVECKAKQSLPSDDITKFLFNIKHKKFDFGYFLYTRPYEHQAAGLISELKSDSDKRYENIYFWGPDKIHELLIASNSIKDLSVEITDLKTSKTILFYSYLGNFYILLLSNSTIPTDYCIIDSQTMDFINEVKIITLVKSKIPEIEELSIYESTKEKTEKEHILQEKDLETIAEIQVSESWDDYKPASSKYFVGRKSIVDQVFVFYKNVLNSTSDYRIFYLEGKSGWGKSSLLNQLNTKSRNMFNKNKYFSIVIDSRSANSYNFIVLAFSKMLQRAVEKGFLPKEYNKIRFISAFDIMSSPKINNLLEYLKREGKLLILIFDQFEDVFSKGNIFKSFYKLLLEIKDIKSNLLLGFSWKTEINVPIDHEAYHLWQQARDSAISISLDEFDYSECNGIVKQLEKAIGMKLQDEFTRKIIDSSQGFPWLVKKLCIHIFKQHQKKYSFDELYDQNLNVEELFKDDLEDIDSKQVRALKYIAERAYNNNSFDATEVDDVIENELLTSLIHSRFVIKSGTKYNIYWDIFRDYLATGTVPQIGETYLIRQNAPAVLDSYLCFSEKETLDLNEFKDIYPKTISDGRADNLLRELRNIGLVVMKNGKYIRARGDVQVEENALKVFLFEKLKIHTFYIEILKSEKQNLHIEDIKSIIKTKIKGKPFSDDTYLTYSQQFLSLIRFAGLNLSNVDPTLIRSVNNSVTYTPQTKPEEALDYFKKLENNQEYEPTKKASNTDFH